MIFANYMHYRVPIPGKMELTQDEVNNFTPIELSYKTRAEIMA